MKLRHRSFLLALLAVPACCQSIPFPGPGAAAAAGGSNGYAHRLLFTFNTHPASNLTAFPNLISGTYAGMADTAHGGYVNNAVTLNGQTVPADLIFTSDAAGTTLLSWEVESWNNTTGAIVAWVKSDRLAASDTLIYAWAGKPSVTTYQCSASATWDGNYSAVWHMQENALNTTVHDSTNANTAVALANTSALTTTSGKIGDAFTSFTGQNYSVGFSIDNANQTNFPSSTGDATWSAWLYNDRGSFASTAHFIVGWGAAAVKSETLLQMDSSNGTFCGAYQLIAQHYGFTECTNYTIPDKTWVLVTYTYTGGVGTFYANGALVYTSTGNIITITASPFNVGGGAWYNGSLDEFRLSKVVRSADWIAHEYTQQSQASAWYTVGSWAP